tara:strand:- start:2649 stop:3992 length:1344 start_codon:yes stop_codon:yes gene_type:complete
MVNRGIASFLAYGISIFFPSSLINAESFTLTDCILWALENKKTVISQKLNVEIARKDLESTHSNFKPSIQLFSNKSYLNIPDRVEVIPFLNDTVRTSSTESLSAGLSLNQKIFNGGRSINQVSLAKNNLNMTLLSKRILVTQVIQNVIESYYSLLKGQELFLVSEKSLEMSNQRVGLIKKQFDLGVIKKSDLLKAKVLLGQAKVNLLNSKTNLSNYRRVLFNSIGIQDFGQEVSINTEEWVMPDLLTSSEILKYIKTKNPSVLIADSQIKLSSINYKLARGLRLPVLNSGLNFSAGGEKRNDIVKAFKEDWRFGIDFSLTVPIYLGNTLSLNEQKIKLSIRQAENNHITLINDLRVQAELIKELLNNYAEIIPLNESVVESSKEDLKLVTKRYALGSSTILEVLDAQVSLTRSNSALINVIYDARIKEFTLDALIGLLDTKYIIRDN